MAESVISLAVERLAGLLVQEAQFLSGVSSQIEEIQTELRRMKCFLKDADARQGGDERVHNWVAEIRDLAQRIEDAIELYLVKVALKRSRGAEIKKMFKRFDCMFQECVILHRVGSEIDEIRTKITNLTSSLQTYGISSIGEGERERSSSSGENDRWRRMSHPHLIEEDFVGKEDDINMLVARLVDTRNYGSSPIISIWGMGGLGKTTIAKKVYNHINVRHHFESFAWVCISQICQTKKVLQDILIQLLSAERKNEVMNMRDGELVERLHKVQQERKCIIVLDDIWRIDDWETLRSAFPIEMKLVGSKLLLTTRIQEVAKLGYHHELQCLNEEEGWELLQKKAFVSTDDAPAGKGVDTKMEVVGRDMVRRCAGLPLAILVLGGILRRKFTLRDWEMVNNDISSYLRRGEGIEQGLGVVSQVLALSFNDLPMQLRPCFLYIGQFQEDERIWADKLCQMWIAEGFVSKEDQGEGESMIDVAERYLGELAQRSMVQVELYNQAWWSVTKRYEACRLHDLVRDLCLSKAKEEEFFNLMHIKSRANQFVLRNSMFPLGDYRTRRFAIYLENHVGDRNITTQRMDQKILHLRSLMLRNIGYALDNSKWPLDISSIGEFKLVRVLLLQGINFPEGKLPRSIKNLIHLRYLRLQNCGLREVPSSISNLPYIEVLDLEHASASTVIMPNVLWKMDKLNFLGLPKKVCLKKDKKLRLNDLTKLETLKHFNTSVLNVYDLVGLASLRDIEILVDGSLEGVSWLVDYLNITTSHHVRGVLLHFKDCDVGSEEGAVLLRQAIRCSVLVALRLEGCVASKFPEYDPNFYIGLTYIGLYHTEFDEDPIPILEKLPNLCRLTLLHISFVGKQMVCSARGFPRLGRLKLWDLSCLEELRVDEGAMPNLIVLVIKSCQNLKMLPDGLIFLTILSHLKIFSMPERFKNRLRVADGVEGEDFYKARHDIIRNIGYALDNSKWPVDISRIGEFKLVRVLLLQGINFPEGKLPRSIKNLIHLRYLRLQHCGLKEVPSSISNLPYIEVFDLEHASASTVIMPNVLWKMDKLNFLGLPKKVCLKKDKKLRLNDLTKLETLKHFNTSLFNVYDLVGLASLRDIEILVDGSLEGVSWLVDYLNTTSSHHVRGVLLHFKDCDVGSEEGVVLLRQAISCSVLVALRLEGCVASKFPEYDPNFYIGLTYLGLHHTEFDEDPIPILEKLPNLYRLTLFHISFVGKQMVCSARGFPQLGRLKLRDLSCLEEWRVDEGAMPNLTDLVIDSCQNLKMLPDGLKFLTILSNLKILSMPESFKNRLRVVDGVEGEDFYKAQHVRSIYIE